MKRRNGLLLLWVQMASCLLLILGGSALALTAAAARAEARAAETADMTLLAEEAMETMKYNERFGASLPIPQEAERNGKRYAVEARREPASPGGLSCTAAAVTVTAERGRAVKFRAIIGPAEEAAP